MLTTSGSTGQRGLFLFSPSEWLDVLAISTRPLLWAGVKPKLFRRQRIAVVGSSSPWHYSAKVGLSLRSRFFSVLQLDAGAAIDMLVERLNEWQPDLLTTYPSVLRSLAEAQLDSRLRIKPQTIFSVAEVFTAQDQQRVREAFGISGRDIYGATEHSPITLECPARRRHLLEDSAAIEIVDEQGRHVPPGTLGSRVLLTVLHRRTQPLIRYELSDMLRLSNTKCECGRPFRVVEEIEGRQQNVLEFGAVRVHPIVFHRALEAVPAAGWQIIREPAELRVCLLNLADQYPPERVEQAIRAAISEAGATPVPVRVVRVNTLQRGPTGKADPILTSPAIETRKRHTGDS